MCVCVCARARVHACMHAYMHACVYACVRTCMRACVHACAERGKAVQEHAGLGGIGDCDCQRSKVEMVAMGGMRVKSPRGVKIDKQE